MSERFEQVAPDDPRALDLYRAYLEFTAELLGITAPDATTVSSGLEAPGGALLLATVDGAPAAIGGVRGLGAPAAEIKAMYVAPTARRRGLGRRLLDRLEGFARASGSRMARLDTLAALEAAVTLYESVGYERIPSYNESPDADLWFERPLR